MNGPLLVVTKCSYRCQRKRATKITPLSSLVSIWYRASPQLTVQLLAWDSCQRPIRCCCRKTLLGSLSSGSCNCLSGSRMVIMGLLQQSLFRQNLDLLGDLLQELLLDQAIDYQIEKLCANCLTKRLLRLPGSQNFSLLFVKATKIFQYTKRISNQLLSCD